VTRTALPAFLSQVALREDCPFVITADLAVPLGLTEFAGLRPDRFLDVGIAEQFLVASAAGMSSLGLPTIAITFASFAMRGIEAFRNLVAYDKSHVILIGSHAGIATGANGPTHHATEDLAMFSSIEGVTCFSPRNFEEATAAMAFATANHGQYYVRLARWEPPRSTTPTFLDSVDTEKPWSAKYPKSADCPEILIFSHGITWNIACDTVDLLHDAGVVAQAIHIGKFPFDEDVLKFPKETQLLITLEDHYSKVGLGRTISLTAGSTIPHFEIGSKWPLGSDDASVLFDAIGLNANQITISALERIR